MMRAEDKDEDRREEDEDDEGQDDVTTGRPGGGHREWGR